MIVTNKDFELEEPKWVNDPNLEDDVKEQLLEMGFGQPACFMHEMPIPSVCIFCGGKLTIPCVMWNCSHPDGEDKLHGVWLHIECAREFGVKLIADADRHDKA